MDWKKIFPAGTVLYGQEKTYQAWYGISQADLDAGNRKSITLALNARVILMTMKRIIINRHITSFSLTMKRGSE